jgi:hypothetical protein
MRTVHKFPLGDSDATHLSLPVGANLLHVAIQNRRFCLWVELHDNPRQDMEEYVVTIVPTGAEVPLNSRYINTFFSDTMGTFVFHAYEVRK